MSARVRSASTYKTSKGLLASLGRLLVQMVAGVVALLLVSLALARLSGPSFGELVSGDGHKAEEVARIAAVEALRTTRFGSPKPRSRQRAGRPP